MGKQRYKNVMIDVTFLSYNDQGAEQCAKYHLNGVHETRWLMRSSFLCILLTMATSLKEPSSACFYTIFERVLDGIQCH